MFKLFWTDELIDKLVEYTNKNAELHPPLEDAQFPRRWKLTSRQELYVYLAVLIHIGLHIESSIKDYWHKDFSHGTMYIVSNYIGANRSDGAGAPPLQDIVAPLHATETGALVRGILALCI